MMSTHTQFQKCLMLTGYDDSYMNQIKKAQTNGPFVLSSTLNSRSTPSHERRAIYLQKQRNYSIGRI